jgi:hypothetical protein
VRNRRVLLAIAWAGLAVALVATTLWLMADGTRGAEIANVLALPVAVLSGVVAVVAGRASRSVDGPVTDDESLLYDSEGEKRRFEKWTLYASDDPQSWQYPRVDNAIGLVAPPGGAVGLNKSVRAIKGRIAFEYRVAAYETYHRQIYFAAIPMQETGIRRTGLIEVGTSVQGHPANARSMYRQRYFVPREHYEDQEWHEATLEFDFTGLDDAYYTIFAPRINEGVEEKAGATLFVRCIRVWSAAH